MIIKIFTGPLNYSVNKVYKQDDDEFIIGVDSGCMHLLKSNIIPDLGIGDFDSVSETEYKTIVSKIKNLKTYDRVKDYTVTWQETSNAINGILGLFLISPPKTESKLVIKIFKEVFLNSFIY